MIRKLQIKFVAMCMILVTAVLGVVFTAVFFSAKQNIEVISHQVLQRVMEDDTPSGRPDLGLNRGGEDVLLPYFTVNLWDRSGIYEAFVTGGTYSNLQDTQELQTILTDCLQQNRPEGTIHSYGLDVYKRQTRYSRRPSAVIITGISGSSIRKVSPLWEMGPSRSCLLYTSRCV